MTVSTLRPASTTTQTGALTGSSGHAALSDDSDASFIDFEFGERWSGGLGDLTLPAGAVIKSLAVRARCRAVTSGTSRIRVDVESGFGIYQADVNWTTATTITVPFSSGGLNLPGTDAGLDAATMEVIGIPPGSVNLRVYEAYLDVTYVEQPDANVTGPTGTITTTNRPTVTWTGTLDSDGGPQAVFQVKIFSDAQYGAGGFDPDTSTPTTASTDDPSLVGFGGGVVSSAESWQVEEILPDDTYRAYVRIRQEVGKTADQFHWSDWDFIEFTVDVDLPAVPDLTATADNTNARITLVIDDNAGAATTDELELQRSTDGGTTWETVRQLVAGNFDAADAPITLYDYEAPNGTEMSYRARAFHDYSGELAASDWTATQTATWSSSVWWLKHPHQPSLNVQVTPSSLPTLTRAGRQGVFQPLGASSVVVVSDTRSPATGAVTLRALTTAAQQDLDDLLDEVATLMLQSPAEEGGPDYIRVINHTRSRIVDNKDATRVWELLEFVVTTSPSGDVVEWPS